MTVYWRTIGSVIQLVQTIRQNPKAYSASNQITFFQALRASPLNLNVANFLSLQYSTLPRTSILNLAINQIFPIFQTTKRVWPQSIIQWFFPFHAARTVDYNGIISRFGLGQSVVVERINPASNRIIFSQSVSFTGNRSITISHSLTMQSTATCYKLDPNFFSISIVMPTPPEGDNGRGC